SFQDLGFGLEGTERLPEAHDVRARRNFGRACPAARGLGERPLGGIDLRIEPGHRRVLLRVEGACACQRLPEPGEANRVGLTGGGDFGWSSRRLGGRRRLGEKGGEGIAPLGRAELVVAGEPELGVEVLQRGEIRLHLLGQLAEVALPEFAHARLELVETRASLCEPCLEKVGGASGLALANLEVFLDVYGLWGGGL